MSASASAESGSSSASIRAGSPPATISDDTVSPVRPEPTPVVHNDTAPPTRARKRRTGSRSEAGSANGWPVWIVTPSSVVTRVGREATSVRGRSTGAYDRGTVSSHSVP